jgi:phospholipase/carboxylesterase
VIHEGLPIARRGPEPAAARAVAVLLHGRGRDVNDALSLAARIDDPEVAFLAPPARDRSWYPQSFLAPLEVNEPHLSSALGVVDGLVGELLEGGVPAERIVLCGFSQGACLTAEYAYRFPRRYGGLVLYTGGLIGPPGTVWSGPPDALAGTPAFLGTAVPDSWVPVERVRETAVVLEALGAAVTLREYPGMDHLVNDEEIAAGRAMLQAVARGA